MFDANMRYLPKGYEFFAEVHSVKKGSTLYKEGVREGHILLCTMLSIGHKNPRIKVHLLHGSIFLRSWEKSDKLLDTCLVYSGRKDLSGFIDDREKAKAIKLLQELGIEG